MLVLRQVSLLLLTITGMRHLILTGTTSGNQNCADFYNKKRYNLKGDLIYVFDKIEKVILERDIDKAHTDF